jgi:hypothetical protein
MAPRYKLQCSIVHNSSSVTHGTRMFIEQLADGRTAWATRWNDLVLKHASDLGGYEILSEAQLSVCRRALRLSASWSPWKAACRPANPSTLSFMEGLQDACVDCSRGRRHG